MICVADQKSFKSDLDQLCYCKSNEDQILDKECTYQMKSSQTREKAVWSCKPENKFAFILIF